jgi:hypothetical protein
MVSDEFFWELVWRHAFGIAFLELAAMILVGYVGLVVQFFRKKDVSAGILCTFCLILSCLLPIGVLLALLFGWLRAGRWQMRSFMAFWTGLVALAAFNFVAIIILRSLDDSSLRMLFGP